MQIPFSKTFIDNKEIEAVNRVMASGWLTTGKVCEEFEAAFADYVGAKYCVFLSSCTAALGLSLAWYRHLGIPKGTRVFVPSLTFAATVNEVVHAGFKPVFGDVKDDFCLDESGYGDELISIPVHLTGNEANTGYLSNVIEDSAHRIEKNQCKGSENLVCFSFYPTKNMTTGEGGAICTNDENAYLWLKKARHHGISKDGWKRYELGGSWKYDIEFVGWKANNTDIAAAIGLEQLKKLPWMTDRRNEIVKQYNRLLGYDRTGNHLYPVLVSNRDVFIETMKDAGIQCSVHFLPVHKMNAYKSEQRLGKTEFFGEHLVSLPLYPSLSDEEVGYIAENALKTDVLIYE